MAAAGIRWSQWMNAKSQAELLVQKKPALLRNRAAKIGVVVLVATMYRRNYTVFMLRLKY